VIVLPLSDYRSLQFFHRVKLSSVIDSLLKAPQRNPLEFKIRPVWGPHVRLDKVDVIFFQIVSCIMGRAHWRAVLLVCLFVITFCSDIRVEKGLLSQIQALFQDDLTGVA